MEFKGTHYPMVITRSRVVLEVASEMVGMKQWNYRQARVSLRDQKFAEWKLCLFGSDSAEVIDEVARGEVHVATINPASPLALAYRGRGPFPKPIALRAIAVLPSWDQLAFAVSESTGLTSVSDILERRYPLRLSMRGQKSHSIHFVVNQVLSEIGFSLDDIVSWGGKVRYDTGLPEGPDRLGAFGRGEIDAIFDEAVETWGDKALDAGMRFLSIEEPHLTRLVAAGFRRAAISKKEYPKLVEDVPTVDFSGWPIFTHADVPDELIHFFCAGLQARKDRIPWPGEGPLPLERMCRDTPEGPLDIPLHPAAERFWRERGYLT